MLLRMHRSSIFYFVTAYKYTIAVDEAFPRIEGLAKSFDLSVTCYRFTGSFPGTECYSLAGQINSAAISFPSNIAEGSSRSSEKAYRRFLKIALESSYELETQLLIADALGYGVISDRQSIIYSVREVQKMLVACIRIL